MGRPPCCSQAPRNGRVLFVNPGFTSHIVELDRREIDVLLKFHYERSVRPEFVVRHHWTAGDIGFWDNRSTQHAVVGDFGAQHRLIQRVTLKGDQPA
ncbi:MAG TPA: TauD/TfdA family dioxygenase [Acidimicrobiales bacterium]|nr:TauD/TfdA family dioxygenase [Acidimicrobiales bacterium]